MNNNNKFVITKDGGCNYISIEKRYGKIDMASLDDVILESGAQESVVHDILDKYKGNIVVKEDIGGFLANRIPGYKHMKSEIEVISFSSEELCKQAIEELSFEKRITVLEQKIKKLESGYGASFGLSRDDIKDYFEDAYFNTIWEAEKFDSANSQSKKGFASFDAFLLNYLEFDLIFK